MQSLELQVATGIGAVGRAALSAYRQPACSAVTQCCLYKYSVVQSIMCQSLLPGVPVALFIEPVLYLEVLQGWQNFSQVHHRFMVLGILEIRTRENVCVCGFFFGLFFTKRHTMRLVIPLR